MRETLERERKLDAEAGFALPELPGTPLEPRIFTSTYYDTHARSLSRAGITLRRRVENGTSLWQLKLPRTGTGNVRSEVEATGGPEGLPRELRALLVAHLRQGELEQIAALRTRRSGIRVESDGCGIADVTVDEVEVLDSGDGFTEIEVELVDGEDADLDRLEEVLRGAGATRGADTPKVLRVVQVDTEPPGPALAAELAAIAARDPGVRLGSDPDAVHQFVLAARRAAGLVGGALADELAWLVAQAAERGRLVEAIEAQRYFDLLDRLAAEAQRP